MWPCCGTSEIEPRRKRVGVGRRVRWILLARLFCLFSVIACCLSLFLVMPRCSLLFSVILCCVSLFRVVCACVAVAASPRGRGSACAEQEGFRRIMPGWHRLVLFRVLLWYCFGSALALLWFCFGSALVLLWFCFGSALVLLWFCFGSAFGLCLGLDLGLGFWVACDSCIYRDLRLRV